MEAEAKKEQGRQKVEEDQAHAHAKDVRRGDRRAGVGVGGIQGNPKKEGHGGKFTWAGPAHDEAEDLLVHPPAPALDPGDPNYTDEGEEAEDARVLGSVDVPKVAAQGVARIHVERAPAPAD